MNTKLISIILTLSLLNLVGCYTTEMLNTEEYIKYEQTEGKPDEIYVITKDSLTYRFSAKNYTIQNDNLIGTGVQLVSNYEKSFCGSILLADITQIKYQTVNEKSEPWIIMGSVAVVSVLVGVGLEHTNTRFFDAGK